MLWALDYLLLALVLASRVLVVRLRNLNGAVMALSAAGTMLSVLFVVLGAPGRRALRGRGRGDRAAGALPGRHRQGANRRSTSPSWTRPQSGTRTGR